MEALVMQSIAVLAQVPLERVSVTFEYNTTNQGSDDVQSLVGNSVLMQFTVLIPVSDNSTAVSEMIAAAIASGGLEDELLGRMQAAANQTHPFAVIEFCVDGFCAAISTTSTTLTLSTTTTTTTTMMATAPLTTTTTTTPTPAEGIPGHVWIIVALAGSALCCLAGIAKGRRLQGKSADQVEDNAPYEFVVQIKQVPGMKIGVGLDRGTGTLHVESLTDSLLGRWNRQHPGCSVQVGDRIVEVNRICDGAQQMYEECLRSATPTMVVRRGAEGAQGSGGVRPGAGAAKRQEAPAEATKCPRERSTADVVLGAAGQSSLEHAGEAERARLGEAATGRGGGCGRNGEPGSGKERQRYPRPAGPKPARADGEFADGKTVAASGKAETASEIAEARGGPFPSPTGPATARKKRDHAEGEGPVLEGGATEHTSPTGEAAEGERKAASRQTSRDRAHRRQSHRQQPPKVRSRDLTKDTRKSMSHSIRRQKSPQQAQPIENTKEQQKDAQYMKDRRKAEGQPESEAKERNQGRRGERKRRKTEKLEQGEDKHRARERRKSQEGKEGVSDRPEQQQQHQQKKHQEHPHHEQGQGEESEQEPRKQHHHSDQRQKEESKRQQKEHRHREHKQKEEPERQQKEHRHEQKQREEPESQHKEHHSRRRPREVPRDKEAKEIAKE